MNSLKPWTCPSCKARVHQHHAVWCALRPDKVAAEIEAFRPTPSAGGAGFLGPFPQEAEIPTVQAEGSAGQWRTDVLPETAGHYDVRSVTTYRWLPYKVPQGGRKGRWQIASEYGWSNERPPARCEWKPNLPIQKGTAPVAASQPGVSEANAQNAPTTGGEVERLRAALDWLEYGLREEWTPDSHALACRALDAGRAALEASR